MCLRCVGQGECELYYSNLIAGADAKDCEKDSSPYFSMNDQSLSRAEKYPCPKL